MFDTYIGITFVDKNPDREDGKGPLPEEDSWEECKIFDVIWLRSKGWGANTKLFDTTDRDEDLQPYVINDTLLTMIRASTTTRGACFKDTNVRCRAWYCSFRPIASDLE